MIKAHWRRAMPHENGGFRRSRLPSGRVGALASGLAFPLATAGYGLGTLVCRPRMVSLPGEDLAGAPVVHEGLGGAKVWGAFGSS